MLGVKETVLCYCCVCVCVCVCVILRTQDKLGPWSPTNHVVTICLPLIGMSTQAHDFSLSLSLSSPPPASGLLTRWGMARALSCCSSALVCVRSLLQQENSKPQKLGLPPGAPTTVIVCIHTYTYTYIHTYTFNAQIQRALTLSLTHTHTLNAQIQRSLTLSLTHKHTHRTHTHTNTHTVLVRRRCARLRSARSTCPRTLARHSLHNPKGSLRPHIR